MVKKRDAKKTGEINSQFLAYNLDTDVFSTGISKINGRYPSKGTYSDTEVDASWFVLEGEAVVSIDGVKHKIGKNDAVNIPKGSAVWIKGDITLVVTSVPPWTPKQQKMNSKKKYRLVENQKRPVWPISDELLERASKDLSDLQFIIFKLARLKGLNNREIYLRIAADPDLGEEYPLNTRESVKTLISRINLWKDENGNRPYQIPPLMKGRDPDENLLQAFLRKAKKTPTLDIVRSLYHGVDERKKINSIDSSYAQARKKFKQFFSLGYDDLTIAKHIFPQLVVNRPENEEDAKKLINFWRQEYETKVSQSNK